MLLIRVCFSLCGFVGQCQVNRTAIKPFSWAECWKWKKKLALRIYCCSVTPQKCSSKTLFFKAFNIYTVILALKWARDKGKKNVIAGKSFIVSDWLWGCVFADCNLLHNAGQVVCAAGEQDRRVFSLSSPFLDFEVCSFVQCAHHRMNNQGFLYWFLSISSNPYTSSFSKTPHCSFTVMSKIACWGHLVVFKKIKIDLKH